MRATDVSHYTMPDLSCLVLPTVCYTVCAYHRLVTLLLKTYTAKFTKNQREGHPPFEETTQTASIALSLYTVEVVIEQEITMVSECPDRVSCVWPAVDFNPSVGWPS